MKNEEVIKVLEEIRIYIPAEQLNAVNYAIQVFQKLEKKNINDILEYLDR